MGLLGVCVRCIVIAQGAGPRGAAAGCTEPLVFPPSMATLQDSSFTHPAMPPEAPRSGSPLAVPQPPGRPPLPSAGALSAQAVPSARLLSAGFSSALTSQRQSHQRQAPHHPLLGATPPNVVVHTTFQAGKFFTTPVFGRPSPPPLPAPAMSTATADAALGTCCAVLQVL